MVCYSSCTKWTATPEKTRYFHVTNSKHEKGSQQSPHKKTWQHILGGAPKDCKSHSGFLCQRYSQCYMLPQCKGYRNRNVASGRLGRPDICNGTMCVGPHHRGNKPEAEPGRCFAAAWQVRQKHSHGPARRGAALQDSSGVALLLLEVLGLDPRSISRA